MNYLFNSLSAGIIIGMLAGLLYGDEGFLSRVYVLLSSFLHSNEAKCLVTLTTSHWQLAQDRNIYLSLKARVFETGLGVL